MQLGILTLAAVIAGGLWEHYYSNHRNPVVSEATKTVYINTPICNCAYCDSLISRAIKDEMWNT